MAARSKRAQLEAQGWKFTPVSRLVPQGLVNCSKTGYVSPAYYDPKNPGAWIVTPPAGHPASQRTFAAYHPVGAIRWASQQAIAPRLQPGLSGVAALTALMGQAQASGVVGDAPDDADRMVQRPDAELLSLCHEVTKARQIAHKFRELRMIVQQGKGDWTSEAARLKEADREVDRTLTRSLARMFELKATTQAGVVAKARVVTPLFSNAVGQKGEAVRSLLADLLAVFEVTP